MDEKMDWLKYIDGAYNEKLMREIMDKDKRRMDEELQKIRDKYAKLIKEPQEESEKALQDIRHRNGINLEDGKFEN
ncbi:hypothetical protein [Sporosarcina cyprini]|uniref:hypothetical protein n=1 Tax=Sporosarcina cyprini TaxID=2910523 RepID=UPI001EDF4A71|nr:hypothetical protein [Sporosarcina cyprini]MCG3088515.1 hypothetical protein [Sporosarcina cyprini]